MSENSGPRILYVEDEPLILELSVTALEDTGFTVDALSSGQSAAAALDARDGDFKALITDIDLGVGPGGWDIAKHARERIRDMPIIYVSGGGSNDWASMGVPGSIIMAKPYASAQLVVAVSTAMLPADRRPPTT